MWRVRLKLTLKYELNLKRVGKMVEAFQTEGMEREYIFHIHGILIRSLANVASHIKL